MKKTTKKAAQLLVECLEAEGVEYIFGVPGEENLAMLAALEKSSIKLVVTRNEQSAVFMAATFGRLTGRAGVAFATLGPGATNMTTGVAYAMLGGMPLVVITGQKPIRKSKQGSFQIINIVRMMEPLTKYARRIDSGNLVPSIVHEAFRIAENERPGACHIELPEDVAEDIVEERPIEHIKIRRSVAGEKALALGVEMIQRARNPIICVSSGGNRKLVRKQLSLFIEKTGIPFVTTQMGKGVIDESSPLYIGTTALSGGDYVHEAINKSDLVIMIGHDVYEKPPINLDGNGPKTLHIHFFQANIDPVYIPTLQVVGDISHTLWYFSKKIKKSDTWNVAPFLKIRKEFLKQKNLLEKNTEPSHIANIVSTLRRVVPQSGMLALDNGMYKIWVARNYEAHDQNSVLLDNALATMGAGVSSGIATKLIYPNKKVVVVAGDGGFMMNVADIETAVRLGIDLVILVLNDSGYGMIRWKQKSMHLASFGLGFSNPDFVKFAESFGAHGVRVEDPRTLGTVLEQALSSKGVHIIDCPVDYGNFNETLKTSTH